MQARPRQITAQAPSHRGAQPLGPKPSISDRQTHRALLLLISRQKQPQRHNQLRPSFFSFLCLFQERFRLRSSGRAASFLPNRC